MIIGIDPGKEGAIVALSRIGEIDFMDPMPLGPDEAPSYEKIKELLEAFKAEGPHIFLERAVSFGMGTKGAFNYGRGFAAIEIALLELDMPFTMVEPKKWTKEIFQGIDSNLKPKAQAIIAIDRLFHAQKDQIPTSPRSKKMHEGIVDALLIAEYGRRQRG